MCTYHFLDTDLTVSAPPDVIQAFDLLYGRFRTVCACRLCQGLTRSSHVLDVTPGPTGRCMVASPWGDAELPADQVLSHLFFLLQNHLLVSVRGFAALHGAALEIHGKGCILSAPSATGKTTLAAALVQRGAGFLSDEIAALSLQESCLHAFPRSLAVRQPAARLLGRTDDPILDIADETKSIIDPDRLGEAGVRAMTRPHLVILLTPPPDRSIRVAEDEQILEIECLIEAPTFAAQLKTLDGVRSVWRLDDRRFPGFRIRQDRGAALMDPIDSLARTTGTLIAGHHRGASLPIDYTQPPRYERLETSAGLMQLMPAILNRQGLLHLGTPVEWLFTLSRRLAAARFYRMIPGCLSESAQQVEDLCRTND